MARETAAQKLARRNAELEAAKAAGDTPPDPPAEPVKAPPIEAPYTLFGLTQLDTGQGPDEELVWVPLGEVKAATHLKAMELAKDAMRDRILARATPEAPAPATLKITVAAIASRNWNQGTAIIESRPVTTWEK